MIKLKELNIFKYVFYVFNLLIVVFVIFLFLYGFSKNDSIKIKINELSKKNNILFQELNSLKNNIELFKDDRNFQKHIIHKEMGYIAKDEFIYFFEEK